LDRDALKLNAQITFLYYDELEPVDKFYRGVMGLKLVQDQGFAKIYRVSEKAFVGAVTGERGFHRPRDENAVLLTFVVDDVFAWYEHLKQAGVTLLSEVDEAEDIGVRAFFLKDPGGYVLEVQRFLTPNVGRVFS
jgi:catechol 2,3-dioxygenase-like lactoylglutathione lyase family enzyme